MNITFNEENQVFSLETANTSYVIGLADGVYPGHIYYGKKLPKGTIENLDTKLASRTGELPFTPAEKPGEKVSFFDSYPFEYATGGTGDYRETSLELKNSEGFTGCEFKYKSHSITSGKPALSGLPATFADEKDAMTLELVLEDDVLSAELRLLYSVFADSDAVLRSAKVINNSDKPIYIEKILSANLDMDDDKYEMINLYGSWARERHIDRVPLRHGRQYVTSTRGITSHQAQPFLALVQPETTQQKGEVYAMHLVYSGNFKAISELDQFDHVRMAVGISDEKFEWKLDPGSSFQSPEAVLVYSAEGLGGMSRTFHDLYRSHLIRSPYLHSPRPILINNWEATYFDFDEDKLLDIARTAKDLGMDMLVMDDGWFGHRDADNSSLGDWKVYEKKLPGGLKGLVDKVNGIGLKFGIWFEPEMISPDSDLYREHPDYVLGIPGREPAQSRNQYVLDLSRQEVVDQAFAQVEAILASANIEYVKWDMNRPLADLGSMDIPADRAGELAHRYMLGVYQLQERLITRFPNLLLENCAGGGSRFDPGMLYYSPQIWCSDDTDALERLYIQEGTALIYPLSVIGSHVSVCPNHIAGRVTPWNMRGDVAISGTFGYELDITKLDDEEKQTVREQIDTYKKYSELVREGDYYRVASVSENGIYDCYQVVSKDLKNSLAVYVQVKAEPNQHSRKIRLQGLDEDQMYIVHTEIDKLGSEDDEQRVTVPEYTTTGGYLMNIGAYIPSLMGDGRTIKMNIVKK